MCLRTFVGLMLLTSVGLFVGCLGAPKSDEIVITGQLMEDGKPAKVDIGGGNLPPGENVGRMLVTFYQVSSEDEPLLDKDGESLGVPSYTADLEDSGRFTILGPSGTGIPFGKYRVTITHIDPETMKDLLGGKFNERRSKLFYDITEENNEIEIDLSKS
ncbi:hypothetical protein GC197_18550 [bacterium]|nr:hypothetical protein [bacterium]